MSVVIRICMDGSVGPKTGCIPEHRIAEQDREDAARMAWLTDYCRREVEARRKALGLTEAQRKAKLHKAREKRRIDDIERKRRDA